MEKLAGGPQLPAGPRPARQGLLRARPGHVQLTPWTHALAHRCNSGKGLRGTTACLKGVGFDVPREPASACSAPMAPASPRSTSAASWASSSPMRGAIRLGRARPGARASESRRIGYLPEEQGLYTRHEGGRAGRLLRSGSRAWSGPPPSPRSRRGSKRLEVEGWWDQQGLRHLQGHGSENPVHLHRRPRVPLCMILDEPLSGVRPHQCAAASSMPCAHSAAIGDDHSALHP